MENRAEDSKPYVALLSSPGIGHLIPILQLGRRLVTHHNFDVTIFVVPSQTSAAESELIQSAMSPKLFRIIQLTPPDITHLVGPNPAIVTVLGVVMRESIPALRSAISALKFRPAALIVDLFGTETMAVAEEFQIPKYVFVPSNAWFLALTIYLPILDMSVQGEYVDQKEPFQIPGCKSLEPRDVVAPMVDRTDQQYSEYLRIGFRLPKSDGIMVNIWEDLQPKTLEALRDEKFLGKLVKVPIYPIGPLTMANNPDHSKGEIFIWLDKQPSDSVVYISFGSGGTLSVEQMNELAWGLEMSQQRFIWIARKPTTKIRDATFFTSGDSGDSSMVSYLPQGFLNRTNDVGLVVPDWAPQSEILSHPSVGGFLSHSGWNSTLESITNGVPMIVWPLYAEQHMNAALLSEEIGVAVRPKPLSSNGFVGREEIARMIRTVMVDKRGAGTRNIVKEVQERALKAISKGGSSYNALCVVAKECEGSWKG